MNATWPPRALVSRSSARRREKNATSSAATSTLAPRLGPALRPRQRRRAVAQDEQGRLRGRRDEDERRSQPRDLAERRQSVRRRASSRVSKKSLAAEIRPLGVPVGDPREQPVDRPHEKTRRLHLDDRAQLVLRTAELRRRRVRRVFDRGRDEPVFAVGEDRLDVLDESLQLDVRRVVGDPHRVVPDPVGVDSGELRARVVASATGERRPGHEERRREVGPHRAQEREPLLDELGREAARAGRGSDLSRRHRGGRGRRARRARTAGRRRRTSGDRARARGGAPSRGCRRRASSGASSPPLPHPSANVSRRDVARRGGLDPARAAR